MLPGEQYRFTKLNGTKFNISVVNNNNDDLFAKILYK